MPVPFQKSFASGEIAPALYARPELNKYQNGLRKARNGIIQRHGGFYNRPGSVFVGEVDDSTKSHRLIDWVFNTSASNSYTLVLGNQTMQFIQNGGFILEAAQNITALTNANPGVFTVTSHGYSNGQEVFVTGVGGTVQVNRDTFFIVQNVTTNTFTLTDTAGNAINTTSYGVFTSGGTVARVYTIATPWAASDIFNLRYAQNQNAMYFSHPSYPPQQLIRTNSTNWTLSAISSFNSNVNAPRGLNVTRGAAGNNTYTYRVTAVYTNGKESLPGTEAAQQINAISKANPGVVTTVNPHNYATGDVVMIDNVTTMTQVNHRQFTITVLTGTTFSIGIDTTNYTTYTPVSGDAVGRIGFTLISAAVPTYALPNGVNWTQTSILSAIAATAVKVNGYNIYLLGTNGQYGLIGSVSGTTTQFVDTGLTPNTTFTPGNYNEVFIDPGNYPTAVTFYQQRLCFANSTNNPTTVWTSNIGDFLNFSVHTPQISSDACTFTIPSQRVNPIQHLRDMGQLIVFSTDGEGSCAGDTSGALTPNSINFRQYSYNGANNLAPIVVDTSALYCQYQGSQIRDLAFDLIVDGYHGNEVNVWSSHLLYGFSLVDWAYAKIPNPIIWSVRNDGMLLGMTYIRDQQFSAWHRHDFQTSIGGKVKSVCAIPETTTTFDGTAIAESAVYLIVQRTINGVSKQYVERLATRFVGNVVDCNYLDSASIFDGRNATGTTMTLTGGVQWLYTENLTLTASGSTFGSWSAGDVAQLTGTDGSVIRCTVQSISSNTVAVVRSNKTVPVSLQGSAASSWARAVQSVSGLWHLAGQNVSILADGYVQANPNNPVYPTATVSATGVLTLPITPAATVHIGLPYTSDMETLNYDMPQGQSIGNQAASIREFTIWLENSRGIWAAAEAAANDTVGTTYTGVIPPMIEAKLRQTENYGQPCNLITDKIEVNIIAELNNNGRISIRQSDPLPMGVTGVIMAGMIPQKGAY